MCNSWAGVCRVTGQATVREVGSSEVTEIPVVHSWSYKDGSDVEMTLSFWGKRGATAEKALGVGDLVFATGNLNFRTYKDKYYFSVQVSEFQKVGKSSSPPKATLEDNPVEIDEELDASIPF